jgi:flagellar hook-associated protein 3 FlgL
MINATGNRMTREIARQSRLAQQIATTQVQVSSGKRLTRASDDPAASARIAALRTAQANDFAWKTNISLGQTLTAQADSVLKNASDLLVRAKELSIAGANQALSPSDRGAIAIELTALADEIESLSDVSSSLGEPLFASGGARIMRFDGDTTFAPVPNKAALFDSGGQSAAQHVRDAATAIASGNASAISASLTALNGAIDQIATSQAQLGINAARLDRIAESQATRAIENSAERSVLEDTDLTEAIARLNAQTITLEAAQAAFARINRRTLFDILG